MRLDSIDCIVELFITTRTQITVTADRLSGRLLLWGWGGVSQCYVMLTVANCLDYAKNAVRKAKGYNHPASLECGLSNLRSHLRHYL